MLLTRLSKSTKRYKLWLLKGLRKKNQPLDKHTTDFNHNFVIKNIRTRKCMFDLKL